MSNLLIYSRSNLPLEKLRYKRSQSRKNVINISKNIFPKLPYNYNRDRNSNKNLYDKSLILDKLIRSSENTQINNSNSNKNSTINSKSNSLSSSTTKDNNKSNNIMNSSIKIKNSKKLSCNNLSIFKAIMKPKDKFKIKINNLKGKSNSIQLIQQGGKFFKTENNKKVIFNNVGMHYHKEKNIINKDDEKNNELSLRKEIDILKNKLNIIMEKFNIIEEEKKQKSQKIENLEEKVENLMYFIKNNNLFDLKEKIQNLENSVKYLKLENEQLKKEINKKNIIFQNLSKINLNKSKGKKKEKKEMQKYDNKNPNINNNIIDKDNLTDIDIQKINQISIDPDAF